MSSAVSLYTRDFSTHIVTSARLTARQFSIHAVGGCDTATITAEGTRDTIWEFVENLRCPVVIRGRDTRAGWWGYVNSVEISEGGVTVGVSLDEMYNRIRVTYSYQEGGGVTTWAEHTGSQAAYGIKEKTLSYYDLTKTGAEQIRSQALARARFPIPTAQPQREGRYSDRQVTATLTCRGWWHTLNWRDAEVATNEIISYTNTTGIAGQIVGSLEDNREIMQQFTVGASNVYLLAVDLLCYSTGSPQDDLLVGVYELNKDGNPEGDSVATSSIFGPLVSAAMDWNRVWFSEAKLAAGRKYGIRISRSGEVDNTNFFTVMVNPAKGYAGGVFRLYNGSEWKVRSTDADMLFRVHENQQVMTTTQISRLVTTYGQFITATDIETASATTRGSYQDGTNRVGRVIEALMEIGKASGRRYFATVTEDRRLRIYQEPLETNPPYRLKTDGVLTTAQGVPLTLGDNPVGAWCKLQEVVPGSVDISRLADPSVQFIESVEWTPEAGFTPRFRGAMSIEDMLRVSR